MSKRAFPLLPLLSFAVVLAAAVLPASVSRVQDRGLFGVTHTEPMRQEAGTQPTAPPQRIDLVRRGTEQDDSDIIFVLQQPPEKELQTALSDARLSLQALADSGILPDDFSAADCEYSYAPTNRLLFRDRSTGDSVSVYPMQLVCDSTSIELTMDVETKSIYTLFFYGKPSNQEAETELKDMVPFDSAALADAFAKQLDVSLTPDPAGAAYGMEYYRVEGTNSCYFFNSSPYAVDITLNARPTFAAATDYGTSTEITVIN